MYANAQAAAAETPPGPNAHLVDDFHKIGITENHLHLWASRGPIGGTREAPLLSAAAVREAAVARRGGDTGGGAATAAAGATLRSVDGQSVLLCFGRFFSRFEQNKRARVRVQERALVGCLEG